jgi:uncharacterized protein YciI
MQQRLRLLGPVLLMFALQDGRVAASEEPTPVQSLYIVEFSTGPGWVMDKPFPEQPFAGDHSANLRRLREHGILILGARHGAKGMVVLRSTSEVAARTEIEKDPSVTAGVFSYTIEEFKPFYGGCIETSG